ncbi:hypothetical protein CcaverHIS002_0601650 [Cutaneotrichosporon cavernicola]|uniref:Ribosomal protein S21 n=1 Tax=Cutaneotrichosporon cavernicola TaxID=279322 RepID=A0AA48L5W8_9TREE|nr:uncharacterized protein CcaverHIS019_0501750 [Cutaneotrichosporon cavernicola]BEI85878.1 hypothetical protein CcaverHIS002_0601650 [Cutaneotrichosporon cavernicola]BEI92547.1 hypothetical protein CcaverHIS019_0501750 [Cutaneotrichosporon cavernicola]BEJ00320.1 hypothetical protein CcaverHIS631_0501770 [Cutaneotrichosporon cavernicola]BEJ08090.1 hypothetical protein CcaverHIS641_0501750 [Cutaneotrichosporon cavernicola]
MSLLGLRLRASLRPLGARAISTPPQRPANPLASVAGDLMPSSLREPADPDAWWRGNDLSQHHGKPGNQYTGRSMPVRNFIAQFRMLQGSLKRSGITNEFRRVEYYEKPSAERVRLASERNRRRFQENIRRRVQQVQALRSRK